MAIGPGSPSQDLFDSSLARAIDAAVGSGVEVIDETGRKIHANDAFCRMVGWSREELVGALPPFAYWPEEEVPRIQEILALAQSGNFPHEGVRLVLKRRNEERFPALLYVAPLTDAGATRGWVANVIDLGPQHAQMEALRLTQERLRLAQAGASVGLWEWEPGAGWNFWSEENAALFGLNGLDVSDWAKWSSHVPEEDFARLQRTLQNALDLGEPFDIEYQFRPDSGELRWIQTKGQAQRDVSGRISRLCGVNLDVTRRRMQEDALRPTEASLMRSQRDALSRSEEQLAMAERAARAGLWDWEIGTGEFRWTQGLYLIFGLDPERASASMETWEAVVHPDDLAGARSAIESSLRTRTPMLNRYRVLHSRLGVRWIEAYGRGWYDAKCDPVRMAGICIDVTDSMLAMERARKTDEQLRRVQFALESVGTAIFWVDAKSGRLTSVNDAAARMLGYERTELEQLTVPEIDVTIPASKYPDVARRVIENGFLRADTTQRRKDGSLVPVEMTVYHFSGQPDQFLGFGVDITERKRAERDLLLAKEQAEAANVAKSLFLANMSHELRTPLNAIQGYSRILREDCGSPEQVASLDAIEEGCDHLLSLINDILDLSKIDSGSLRLAEGPFRLSELLKSALAMVSIAAAQKGLTLTMNATDVAEELIGDAARLRQALVNLLANAVKFTERGSVSLNLSVIDDAADGITLRFEVIDTGIGIAAQDMDRLFVPFEQIDGSSTRSFDGTGLGLAITRRLVHMMNGDVGARSSLGAGSNFWFTARVRRAAASLPPSSLQAGSNHARERLRHDHGGARILLVEDNRTSRALARRMLLSAGLQVIEAVSGEDALDKAKTCLFDLVLMDISMPRMSGLAATTALRRLPGWSRIPIIAVTGNAFESDRQACLDAGMNAFVTKPVQWSELWPLLGELLDRKQ